MTFSFDNVTGNTVDFQDLSSAVSFLSPSDALFASFFYKHINTSWELIDDLLLLFKTDTFHPQEVTFSSAESICDRVREQRRASANTRDLVLWKKQQTASVTQQHCTSVSTVVPTIIVELVAEQIYSEREPLFDVHTEWESGHWSWRGERPTTIMEETLRSMTLVYKSWTGAAQRCLRRRLCVWSQLELQNLFHSPQVGPWVRELSYRENHPDECVVRRESIPRLLCGILQRCPNLEKLLLDVELPPVSSFLDLRFVNQLGSLTSLENLWLHQVRKQHRSVFLDFKPFFSMLGKLRSLKSLSLGNLDVLVPVKPDGYVADLFKHCPDLGIESMSFVGLFAQGVAIDYFTWLIERRQKLPSTSLEIDFLLLREILENFLDLPTANITKLQIRFMTIDSQMMTAAFRKFPSIKSLILVISDISTLEPDGIPVIPATVTFLHIHIDLTLLIYDHLKPEHAFVNPLLKASPHLQEIIVSASKEGLALIGPDGNELQNDEDNKHTIYPFDSTYDYCKEKGIIFQLIESRHPPTFDEHSTDSTRKVILSL